jgi:putative pyruvate formate lyase activating enzyme
MSQPSYIGLYKSGELEKRSAALQRRLLNCDICPRKCSVNRMESGKGFCRSGRLVFIASYCDHHGEEPVLSGTKGSGTVFFSNCNLKCTYCQNFQISQGTDANKIELDSPGLAAIMLHLQDKLGCHNINLVSPSHFVPQIVEAVLHAVRQGLKIPLVYNTNAYDSLETLQALEGIIDIYLPDLKYSSDKWAHKYSGAKNYVGTSRRAIAEMFRQVGNLVTNEDGLAQKGLIVRHLILPHEIAGSADSLKWLAEKISRDITVSIMAQYYPSHMAARDPLLSRKINSSEYNQVISLIEELGLENGWLQEIDSAEFYLPDFDSKGHPFE